MNINRQHNPIVTNVNAIVANRLINQSIKELATVQTVMQYHDGQVDCRLIENRRLGRKFFITGQIARCVKTGKFVSFRDVFN